MKLLPCPFCDGSVQFHSEPGICDGCHHIWCPACNVGVDFAFTRPVLSHLIGGITTIDGAESIEDLRVLAAEKWNRRNGHPYVPPLQYDDKEE